MSSIRPGRSLAAAAALAAAALALAACGSSGGSSASSGSSASFTGSPVVIGQEICQTGYLTTSDYYLAAGAQLAVSQINKAGGILHHKVELQTKDTQCVASNEITIANQFIEQDHVSAIIGGYQSAAIQGLVPVVEQAKVPLIGAGTLPLTSAWGFTTFPLNVYPGQAFLSYIINKYHVKSLGNITGDTPYGTALQADVASQAKAAGITTKEVEIADTATTTTPVLQKMSGTQAIFTNTSGPINIIFAKDASSLGLKVPLIFLDSATDCEQAAAAYQPVYCVVPQATMYPDVSNPTIKANDGKLWDAYKATGGKFTNFEGVTVGADQVELLAKAMETAKSVDGAAVEKALASESYVGAQATYAFKPDHPFGMSSNAYVLTLAKSSGLTIVATPGS